MNTAYDDLVEGLVGLALEIPNVEFFLVNVKDAIALGLTPRMDDKTGAYYFDVEGFRVFPSLEVPEGTVGTCVRESAKINVGFVGSC